MEVIDKPEVIFYIDGCFGRYGSRLFHIGDIIYCSISTEENIWKGIKLPEGFNEVKASEFFKAIEDERGKDK